MLKLLINITDLLNRLGFLVIFLLPFVGLVLVGLAVFLVFLGIGIMLKMIISTCILSSSESRLLRAYAYKVEFKVKNDFYSRDEKVIVKNRREDCK